MTEERPFNDTAADAPVPLSEVPEALREQWSTLLGGSELCLPQRELLGRLREGKPLRVKIGCDPTAADLHLGHAVPLMKLRQFQDFGHQVVFIIGDWTARIGDPSGKSETRPPLSAEEVEANAATYFEQVSKILDMDRTEVRHNNEWLGQMTSQEMVRLAACYTVARMLERDDFKRRFREGRPVRIHEFLYPLAQGYDSVAIQSDVELGGTDQTFNLLVAREIQEKYGMRPQAILTMPILVGLDGVQKMSKSLGNFVGISEPPAEMFGKVMSITDELMPTYFELCLGMAADKAAQIPDEIEAGRRHPRDTKAELARRIVLLYHGEAEAQAAEEEFNRVFRERQTPDEVDQVTIDAPAGGIVLLDLLVQASLAESRGEAKRLVGQGGVSLSGERAEDPKQRIAPGEYMVKVGKRRFRRVLIK